MADLEKRSGLSLDQHFPVSRVYQGIVSVFDNRTVQYHGVPHRVLRRGINVLHELMNEDGHKSEGRWYWSWENPFPI